MDADFSENPATESICFNGPICFKCSLSNSLQVKDTVRTWWRGKKANPGESQVFGFFGIKEGEGESKRY